MRKPVFEIVEDGADVLVIRDIGPWDFHPTVTNAAEEVVRMLAPILKGRRLEYYDSDGNRDQIIVKDGEFVRFAPCNSSDQTTPSNLGIPTDNKGVPMIAMTPRA